MQLNLSGQCVMINLAEGEVFVFVLVFLKEIWSPWLINILAMAVTETEYLVPGALIEWIYFPRDIVLSEERQWQLWQGTT